MRSTRKRLAVTCMASTRRGWSWPGRLRSVRNKAAEDSNRSSLRLNSRNRAAETLVRGKRQCWQLIV